MLRGNIRSNIQYSIVNSKTRNGAFGIKGWISGK
jgi:ribosomal protein S3